MALDSTCAIQPDYDRKAELRAFDETRAGVKGLVDAGITEVPRIFRLASPENLIVSEQQRELILPTIDLEGIEEDPIRRKEVVGKVKDALESWGFFQMVNHGIPIEIMEGMALDSTCAIQPDYDRKAELRAFDETRAGVKGLVDAGITEVPRIFRLASPENLIVSEQQRELILPTIDLEGIEEDPIRRKEVVGKVKDALESWGFFQMVNHGIPIEIMEGMALDSTCAIQPDYDRKAELRAFDETRAGVKGLVDAGITEVPRIFRLASPENLIVSEQQRELILPTIDLEGIEEDPIRRKEVVGKVKDALESWGFFQMVNHGIPIEIMEGMALDSTCAIQPDYDRKAELRAFDETRAGVKGLVDAGITEVPRIFRLASPENLIVSEQQRELILPTIDLEGIEEDPIRRKEVVGKVKDALESWGFFQMDEWVKNSRKKEVLCTSDIALV
ncbi:hypothetical protein R6Q57_025042 [Mikania cordata]